MGDNASDMERMIELFLSLDCNEDGIVDLQELKQACADKKLDSTQTEKWLATYDANKDGKITLDEFCDGLGLNNDEMKVEKEERDIKETDYIPTVNPQIRILDNTMSLAKQVQITDLFIELATKVNNNPKAMNDVAAELKKYLDDRYGRVWQVVILAGSYWVNYSHAPLMAMQFQFGPYICLVWRVG